MVTARRVPLPLQESREGNQLQGALEDLRRQNKAAPRPFTIAFSRAADAAASDASNNFLWRSERPIRLISAGWLSDDNVTADATDYAIFAIFLRDANGSDPQRTIARINTSDQGLAIADLRDLPLDHTQVGPKVTIALSVGKAGAGVSLPAGRLLIEAEEYAR